ncbi:MAG: sulfotransferase domain-containing protein [Verrucomicrobiota bacterium]
MFSVFGLKQFLGYHHIDYARQISAGEITQAQQIVFHPKGHVYGPLRLSAIPATNSEKEPTQEYWYLIRQAATSEFVAGKRCLFFVRDPRDIIVSAYFSFRYSHRESTVPEIAERQRKSRAYLLSLSIDDYALGYSSRLQENFQLAAELIENANEALLLRYEDMIEDWETFAERLSEFVPVKTGALEELRERSRPKTVEEVGGHQRSGKTQQFREHLSRVTLTQLNQTFAETLVRFGYPSS